MKVSYDWTGQIHTIEIASSVEERLHKVRLTIDGDVELRGCSHGYTFRATFAHPEIEGRCAPVVAEGHPAFCFVDQKLALPDLPGSAITPEERSALADQLSRILRDVFVPEWDESSHLPDLRWPSQAIRETWGFRPDAGRPERLVAEIDAPCHYGISRGVQYPFLTVTPS